MGFRILLPFKKLFIFSGVDLCQEVRLNPNYGMCHVITYIMFCYFAASLRSEVRIQHVCTLFAVVKKVNNQSKHDLYSLSEVSLPLKEISFVLNGGLYSLSEVPMPVKENVSCVSADD